MGSKNKITPITKSVHTATLLMVHGAKLLIIYTVFYVYLFCAYTVFKMVHPLDDFSVWMLEGKIKPE